MPRATKLRDRAHARLYADWLALPAWRSLTPAARVILLTLLALYRPASNPSVRLSIREIAKLTAISRSVVAVSLRDLEDRGWLRTIARGTTGKASVVERAFTLMRDPVTHEPPSRDFEAFG
jgi:DNA-binding MarR family transcriptional regulator